MLPPSKIQKLEIFGGTGIGRATDIDYFEHSNHYKCNYYSFFIQGNFGLKKRVFETGGSLRIAYSKFKVAANIYVNSSEDYLYRNNFNAFHFEPMGFTRIGNENLKIVFRYGINLPIPTSSIEKQTENSDIYFHNRLSFNFFHFSIGMSYRISGITKN